MAGPDPAGLESDPIGVLADRLGPARVRGQFALGGIWQCPPPWHPQGGAVTPRRGLSLRGWGSGPFHRDLSRPSGRPKRPSPRGSGQRASGQLLRGAGESWPLGLPRGSPASPASPGAPLPGSGCRCHWVGVPQASKEPTSRCVWAPPSRGCPCVLRVHAWARPILQGREGGPDGSAACPGTCGRPVARGAPPTQSGFGARVCVPTALAVCHFTESAVTY